MSLHRFFLPLSGSFFSSPRKTLYRTNALIVVAVIAASLGVAGIVQTTRLSHWSDLSSIRKSLSASAKRFAPGLSFAKAPALKPQASNPVATVSAASYETAAIAPESIVAAFGVNLATQTLGATTLPLPTTLGGTVVEINGQVAPLFFVSSGQVNFVIPSGTVVGSATVVVHAGNGTTSNGTVQVSQAGPAVFSANSDGQGVPAASLLRVKANNEQIFESPSQFNAATGRIVTRPIDLGPDGERVFLVLFLSGIRKTSDPNGDGNVNENVRIVIGGVNVIPDYAGAQPNFIGLDQINAVIPRSLIGRGKVNLSVTVTGFGSSNLGELEIAGTPSNAPPVVTGFGSSNVLAGQTLIINGSGFANNMTDNTVRIAGTEADLNSAAASQLSVTVPFGVETGAVSVRTPQGEGASASSLPVRTSISGFVEDTNRQPMTGVTIKMLGGSSITTTTNSEGLFILPDVPAGPALVEMDSSNLTNPPYPKVTLKTSVTASRDNQFAQPIAMQQATGPSLPVGTGGAPDGAESPESGNELKASIQTSGVTLDVPAGSATFPDGSTGGSIFLTIVENSRTPVGLPAGFFSTAIAQITPFGVTLNPGGKLSFPNPDNLPAGTQAKLFRFDQANDSGTIGEFIEAGLAVVSGDGLRIETVAGAITQTGIYFVSVLRQTTTVVGRVVDSGGTNPVRRALVRLRGREVFTDGNGAFILRNVPVKPGEQISVEVSYIRPNGRIERKQSNSVPVVSGGITIITPAVELPSALLNRPPAILAPFNITRNEGTTSDMPFVASDPDRNQTVDVSVSGANFVTPIRVLGDFYVLRLSPGFNAAGSYSLTLTATDNLGLSTTRNISLTVRDINRPPVLVNPGNKTLSENTTVSFTLAAADPDAGQSLTYSMTPALAGATLNPTTGAFSYTPSFGVASQSQPTVTQSVTFTVTDNGSPTGSASQTISITVNNVNRPPSASPQGVTLNEDIPTSITLVANDPDGDPLSWTITTQPQHGTLTGTAPNLTYTPAANYNGNDSFTFRVSDGLLNSNVPIVSLTINPVNDPPVLTVPGPQTINEGQSLRFTASATDVDPGQTITLSATGAPSGSTFDAVTGNFSWTPNFTQAATYAITFKATDNGLPSASDTKTVTITVNDVQHDFAIDPENFIIYGDKATTGLTVPDPGDAVGTSVVVGDLNGDGINDLAVGAPTANNGTATDSGRVYIFFGKLSNGLIDLQKQSPDVILNGENSGDQFGASLAIGDLSGDGNNDLIIGAPRAVLLDVNGRPVRTDCGKVYARFGKFTAGTFAISQVANVTIIGSSTGDRLGFSVAAGNVRKKNGPADLIASAPLFDVPGATSDAGRVYVFSSPTGTIDLASKSADFTVTGPTTRGQIGTALATGDVNGDGFAELAIGAPVVDSQNLRGATYLVYGSSTLAGDRSFGSQQTDLLVLGRDAGDRSGGSVMIGDLNNDGKCDLIIGAPNGAGASNQSPFSGEVYIFYGTATLTNTIDLARSAADVTIYGAASNGKDVNAGLGVSLAVGDYTGDGIVDLALGAPNVGSGIPRTDCGAVYLIFGSKSLPATIDLAKTSAPLTIFGADTGDQLGSGGLALGELNTSSPADLVIGIPRAASLGNQRAGAGEVRVLFGRNR